MAHKIAHVGRVIAVLALGGLVGAGEATAQPGMSPDEIQALRARVTELEAAMEAVKAQLEAQEQALQRTQEVAAPAAKAENPAIQPVPGPEPKPKTEAADFSIAGIAVDVGGYIKTDLIFSSTSDGSIADGSAGRDFYVPATIPVGGEADTDVDMHARQSRLFFTTATDDGERKITSRIELDFLTTTDGNEQVSNSYAPRLRRAFATYGNWLFGQEFSRFVELAVFPETLDFVGPFEALPFVRQAQIRYTDGPWSVSVENPQTTVTTATGGRVSADDGVFPDVTFRYRWQGQKNIYSITALGRWLHLDDNRLGTAEGEGAFAGGVNMAGRINVNQRNDVRFGLVFGRGLGRYVAGNLVNAAAFDAEGDLEPTWVYAAHLAYRHFWNPKLRSSLVLGAFHADQDEELTGGLATEWAGSFHGNLLYSPVPKVTVGGELIWAGRELSNGDSGTLSRLQFSARYDF